MKKLVIILPVLVSLLVFSGFANAGIRERVNTASYSLEFETINCSFEIIIDALGETTDALGATTYAFGKAADDGGALGEKAQCQAMLQELEKPSSEISPMIVQTNIENSMTASPEFWSGLTAIREEEV